MSIRSIWLIVLYMSSIYLISCYLIDSQLLKYATIITELCISPFIFASSILQLCCSVHWLCSLIRLSSCSDKVLMATTAAACILPRIQFQWGRDYHRFSLTLIRSCECPLAHPCDRVGLFSILLPKCKPNQSRSLLEIFCDCPVPRNKNSTSCDLQSPMQSSSAALSSLLSAHSSPHF